MTKPEFVRVEKGRWCIYCGVDCYEDEPEHQSSCPTVTRLFPVTERELQPHGFGCARCGAEFHLGDVYTYSSLTREMAEQGGIWEREPGTVRACVCLGCGVEVGLLDD